MKKCGLLKILHEKYPSARNKQKQTLESREFHDLLLEAAQEILNPLRVLYLFKTIPDEVCIYMYMYMYTYMYMYIGMMDVKLLFLPHKVVF